MNENTQEKIWNISLVVEDIRKFPQTYKTILKGLVNNGTYQTILRRKLNSLCKNGDVCKTNIPGTRFGKAIFYTFPKDYFILVEGTRTGSEVYCFFDFKKLSRYYIRVKKIWQLKDNCWYKYKNKTFFEGNVLKFI